MQGMPLQDYHDSAKLAGLSIRDFKAPGPSGESWIDVNFRAQDFLQNEILEKQFNTKRQLLHNHFSCEDDDPKS